MPRESKEREGIKVVEYVTVAFAEDMDLAKQYQELLKDNGISTRIKRQPEMTESGFSDIAIMVPEEFLDEAHVLISEKDNADDFFDMVFDDQDNQEFDYSDYGIEEDEDLYE